MSPQSRATSTINTTTFASSNGWSTNACSLTTVTAEINWASSATDYLLNEIDSDSSTGDAHLSSPIIASEQQRKRSSSCVSPPKNQQPFLSSYGSAFLSGIFADMAQATDDDDTDIFHQDDEFSRTSMGSESSYKKARITATPTSFHGRHQVEGTSSGISTAAEGAVSEGLTPPVVSPRIKPKSALKIQIYNDSVRMLQDMAFPSLSSQIPNTISSSSCVMQLMMDEVVNRQDEQEGPSYGWFVWTDDDLAEDSSTESYPGYVPATKSVADLAFKAISPTPVNGTNQDVEVQQALAADTIDDVLGDLF